MAGKFPGMLSFIYSLSILLKPLRLYSEYIWPPLLSIRLSLYHEFDIISLEVLVFADFTDWALPIKETHWLFQFTEL